MRCIEEQKQSRSPGWHPMKHTRKMLRSSRPAQRKTKCNKAQQVSSNLFLFSKLWAAPARKTMRRELSKQTLARKYQQWIKQSGGQGLGDIATTKARTRMRFARTLGRIASSVGDARVGMMAAENSKRSAEITDING